MAVSSTAAIFLQQRAICTQAILSAKQNKNAQWEDIAKAVGRSPVWVTSCCLGENSMDEPCAEKLVQFLEIKDPEVKKVLMHPPLKCQTPTNVLLQDPCIYRLYEATMVYGLTFKELLQEKFGDGIMSAIDFEMEVEKVDKPEGNRVNVIMSGKYLPYRRW